MEWLAFDFMTLSRDSLGGQNSHRRVSGARSSRALSTIFKQLRNADRKIAELDRFIRYCWNENRRKELEQRRSRLDMKRQQIRAKRKGYLANNPDQQRRTTEP